MYYKIILYLKHATNKNCFLKQMLKKILDKPLYGHYSTKLNINEIIESLKTVNNDKFFDSKSEKLILFKKILTDF